MTRVRRTWNIPISLILAAFPVMPAAAGTGGSPALQPDRVRVISSSDRAPAPEERPALEWGVNTRGAPDCGDQSISQSTNPTTVSAPSVWCGNLETSSGTTVARAFTAGNTQELRCVTFGVSECSGGDWPVRVRLLQGRPDDPYDSLTLLSETEYLIPDGTDQELFTVEIPQIIMVAGSDYVVELLTPSRFIDDGGDGGLIALGFNNLGQSAPSYFRAPDCDVHDFVTLQSIGFGNRHLVMALGVAGPNCYVCDPAPPGVRVENESHCATAANGGCDIPNPAFTRISDECSRCGNLWLDETSYDTDWYRFDLSSPGSVTVNLAVDADFGVIVEVYEASGCPVGPAELVASYDVRCYPGLSSWSNSLNAGTYLIRLVPGNLNDGPYDNSGINCGYGVNYQISVQGVPGSCDDIADTISGRVLNCEGVPQAEASVELEFLMSDGSYRYEIGDTDINGQFAIRPAGCNEAAGPYIVRYSVSIPTCSDEIWDFEHDPSLGPPFYTNGCGGSIGDIYCGCPNEETDGCGIPVETIVLRSGQVGGSPGNPGDFDDTITQYAPAGGSCFSSSLVVPGGGLPFDLATGGSPAVVLSGVYPGWSPSLACDPQARWINSAANAAGEGRPAKSTLYSHLFHVATPDEEIGNAFIEVCWMTDDSLGDPAGAASAGFYLRNSNGLFPLPHLRGGSFSTQNRVRLAFPSGAVQSGINELLIYQRDTACIVSGIIYSATITICDAKTIRQAPVPGNMVLWMPFDEDWTENDNPLPARNIAGSDYGYDRLPGYTWPSSAFETGGLLHNPADRVSPAYVDGARFIDSYGGIEIGSDFFSRFWYGIRPIDDFSVDLWMRSNLGPWGIAPVPIVNKMTVDYNLPSAFYGYSLSLERAPSHWSVRAYEPRVRMSDGTAFIEFGSNLRVVEHDGFRQRWNFLGFSLKRNGNAPHGVEAAFYVNGIYEPATVLGASGSFVNAFILSDSPLQIGFGPGPDDTYRGMMDELEMFKRALEPSEFDTIYHAGRRGKAKQFCSLPVIHNYGLSHVGQLRPQPWVFNGGSTPKTFWYTLTGVPASGGDTVDGPSVFSPNAGSITVPPYEGARIPISVARPAGLTNGKVAYYDMHVWAEGEKPFSCRGQLRGLSFDINVDFPDPSPEGPFQLPVISGDFGDLVGMFSGPITVSNPSLSGSVEFEYRVSVLNPEGELDAESIGLNGQLPGQYLGGTVQLAPGATTDIPLDLTVYVLDPLRTYQVVMEIMDDQANPSAWVPFTSVSLNYIVDLDPTPPCLADLAEPFGLLDLADIVAFITTFTNADPPADLAEPFGLFDLADIVAFIDAFLSGCP